MAELSFTVSLLHVCQGHFVGLQTRFTKSGKNVNLFLESPKLSVELNWEQAFI